MGGSGGCGSAAAIEVTRIGSVALTPSATISCPLAAELDDWLKTSVQPAAKARLGTSVTEIHVAASYVCRRRNNSFTGKLSEHGKANALDMSGFSFAAQKEVTVAGGGGWGSSILGKIGLSKGGSFLGDIRKGPARISRRCWDQGRTPITAIISTWTCCSGAGVTGSASEPHRRGELRSVSSLVNHWA